MRVEKSIEIAAAPERIWSFLVEPDKILQWCITLERFEYTGEQLSGVGTPFYFEERAGGRLMKLNFAVTEWVENKALAFRMTSGNMVRDYEQRWAMEPTASGSRFAFMENVELPYGIIGKALGLIARPRSEAIVGRMLVRLNSLAEAA
jgi:uncharacterized protein YndB with AHSA1/START domain